MSSGGRQLCRMNLRRGSLRLGALAAALFFVFWTFAYVVQPYSSIKPQPASFADRIGGWNVVVPCAVVALLVGVWAAAGFRPD